MNDIKYIGLDIHQATIAATVLDSRQQVSDGSHSGNQRGNYPAVLFQDVDFLSRSVKFSL